MKPDKLNNPKSVRTISVSYGMLLGQYCRKRSEIAKKENKHLIRFSSELIKARKHAPDRIPPEDRVGFWAGTIDLFRNEIVENGADDD